MQERPGLVVERQCRILKVTVMVMGGGVRFTKDRPLSYTVSQGGGVRFVKDKPLSYSVSAG